MPAFAFLQRMQATKQDLIDAGHSPQAVFTYFKDEGRFILFMTLTLVTALLLQNAVTKLLDALVKSIFPESEIKASLLELLWSLLFAPIVITLSMYGSTSTTICKTTPP